MVEKWSVKAAVRVGALKTAGCRRRGGWRRSRAVLHRLYVPIERGLEAAVRLVEDLVTELVKEGDVQDIQPHEDRAELIDRVQSSDRRLVAH